MLYNCYCYVHDDRFISSDNLTLSEIFFKNLKLSDDLIVPSIDKNEAGTLWYQTKLDLFIILKIVIFVCD